MAGRAAPFVGREAEAELLAAALEAAAAGRPRFMLVVGEAGIGKTRLLRHAAERAAGAGLRVLEGTAIEGGAAMPYLPLLAPLSESAAASMDEAAGPVSRLLTGEASSEGADAAGAARLVESIFRVLTREPTLLVVDDAHWADASTLAVLDHVSRRARTEPLAVFAAARDDEPGRLERVPIADGRRFVRLQLARLTEDQVRSQVAALVGGSPDSALVTAIYRRSAGNPFFVEQLLAASDAEPPASLRALVGRRLSGLADDACRAVEALAVIGRPADEPLIAAVAGIGKGNAEAALREAVRRGIAVAEERGFALRHPLFAEVLVGALAGPARRRLHRRSAEALAARGAESAEIAAHWWEAGDPRQAWAAALEAAERAERIFAFAETRLHLERALAAWPAHADGRSACMLRVANAAWLSGDPDGALAAGRRALAEGADDSAEVQLALASYAWDAADVPTSVAAFARAASLAGPHTPASTRARTLWGAARACIGRREYVEARAAAAQSAELAHEAGDTETEARARFTVGLAHAYEGSLTGIADIEHGVALALGVGSPVAIGHGYQFLTNLVHLAGDLDRALELSLTGIDACERVGLARSHASDLRGRAALVLVALGRWPDADDVLAHADSRALPCLAAALLAMRRGRLADAGRLLDDAARAPAIGGPGALQGELELALAELRWLGGDTRGARAALEQLDDARDVWHAATSAQRSRLAARLAADDRRHAVVQPTDGRHPDPLLDEALRAEVIAERARAAGAADAGLWAACLGAWEVARRPYDAAYARLRYAEALFATDERSAATAALRDASASASDLGARPLRTLAEQLARRARVSPDPPRRREPARDEPTARELDVLTLVAEGLTNREIGARLFLSPKTVGIHVSRLLRKLDARTRGEAVAVARRRGLLA